MSLVENGGGQLPPGLERSLGGSTWAWATEHAAAEWASTEQLVSWLARGELPPHVLVWKPGWGEWLPAMQVAELAVAFPRVTPGSRRVARAAPECTETPPAVPVEHYPRLRLLAKDVLGESLVPPAAAVPNALEPAQVGRRALRDLDHLQKDLVTSQVPAAAMLEAARTMKRPGAPLQTMAERWGRLELGTFGEPLPPGSLPSPSPVPPPVTLSALALELPAAALRGQEPSPQALRHSSGYGPWLLFGALVGGSLGLLSLSAPETETPTEISALQAAPTVASRGAPPAPALEATPPAREATPVAPSATEEAARIAAAAARRAAGIVQVKRQGETATQQALRVAKNDGFDRVVFEFQERVPGYRLQYVDKPVRGCAAGDLRHIAGDSWLEVRFSPASAHTESGEPSLRERELRPALSSIREIERTCDFEGVVTWVVGTPSPRRYRAYELSAPPRLVVQIDH